MRLGVFGGALAGAAAWIIAAGIAGAQTPCGGPWNTFLEGVAQEARNEGVSASSVDAILNQAHESQSVLDHDRSQGVFKQTFLEFSANRVSKDRLDQAASMRKRYAQAFERAEQEFGIPSEVILAFWAMETDFGGFMGDFPVIPSLATLAHDCRRPELFRPHLIAAMKLHERGDFHADETGAWAGEIGHVQVLPATILDLGVDGDGDGHVRVKASAPDAILTAANLLAHHGWRRGEPWVLEATAPEDLDWSLSGFDGERTVAEWRALGVKVRSGDAVDDGLSASLLPPQGRKGPKFLVFPNFRDVFLEWNKSLINTLTAGYLATRIGGAERYLGGDPEPGLDVASMKELQQTLQGRGHDVGEVDGVLGEKTRIAVRTEQARLGLPADGWPTAALVRALR